MLQARFLSRAGRYVTTCGPNWRDVLAEINGTPVGRRRTHAEKRGGACGDRPHAASLRHDIQLARRSRSGQ